MSQPERRAALSAFAWTVTVMALAGGAVFYVGNQTPAPTAATTDTATVAQYAAALDTANARLTEAGTRISQLEAQVAQQQTDFTPAQDAAPAPDAIQTVVSAEQAIEYAKQIAGQYPPTNAPELVDLEGQTVWAIPYEPGTVYVNAQDGSIALVERNQPQGGRPGHHDEDHESESSEHDD